ncbi:hypothetical protein HN415_10000, partial [Candidatus Woesearchaeota archaeon]|nr:hypothetical protein [Candidatus Woesearchaeota archaeon]
MKLREKSIDDFCQIIGLKKDVEVDNSLNLFKKWTQEGYLAKKRKEIGPAYWIPVHSFNTGIYAGLISKKIDDDESWIWDANNFLWKEKPNIKEKSKTVILGNLLHDYGKPYIKCPELLDFKDGINFNQKS